MSRILSLLCSFTLWLCIMPAQAQDHAKPNITILATGGTIAGSGSSATQEKYTSGQIMLMISSKLSPTLINLLISKVNKLVISAAKI